LGSFASSSVWLGFWPWEISQRTLIDMAADRAAFIDQSQSFNVFMETTTVPKLTSMHFYGWKKGVKTGMYYLRTRPSVDAIKFTLEPSKPQYNISQVQKPVRTEELAKEPNIELQPTQTQEAFYCTKQEGCNMCGS